MKKYFIFILTLVIIACNDKSDSYSFDNPHIDVNEQEILNNSDYLEIVKIDDYIQREIIKGTYSLYKEFISEEIKKKGTYCNILSNQTQELPKDLKKFLSQRCERRKHFESFVSAHPEFLKMSVKDKLALKNKAKKQLNLEISPSETLNIYKQYRDPNNNSINQNNSENK